ncbi:MAG: hypothetical protein K2X03_24960 [Bryobacteraceae bacterium]|nr:hypothetical protein [Bryobacteraceae bacterium]
MKRLLCMLAAFPLLAHVGSPDVYLEGSAGPYPVLVTVRPPVVIPGVAEVEIRALGDGVQSISITPTPMTGPGAQFAPTADSTKRDPVDPRTYTGSLWMMSSGSWQVRVRVEGKAGRGELRVPVPTVSVRTLPLGGALGATLFTLMVLLVLGLIAIAGAAVREAQLPPASDVPPVAVRKGRLAMLVTAVLLGLSLWGGNQWWTAEANDYARYRYKALKLNPSFRDGRLQLNLEHTGWFQSATFDDLVPDHGKIMHLFVVRLPDLDHVWHLHPEATGDGEFTHALPAMPAGRYQLYADVVHKSGFPETLVAEVTLPEVKGSPAAEDDSSGAVGRPLRDGYRILFETANQPIIAKKAANLRFRFVDAQGNPPKEQELYLGMPGHAMVLRRDRGVFAHLHPSGTVPMAALELAAQGQLGQDPHAVHRLAHSATGAMPNVVAFPYGFPSAGSYRLFVQIKRAGHVETAAFDLQVNESY